MKTFKHSFILFCLSLCCIAGIQAQTKVIAHRGFWKTEGSAQNSITALQKAAEANVYGSEFDVQLTSDGIVVVNHDDAINGIVIGNTPYEKLKDITIANGEKLPTLEDYLKAGKKLDVQLILEIKPHRTKEIENQAVETIVKMVKKYKLTKKVEYISFSLNVCEQLAKLTPKSEIAYLNGEIPPKELKEKGINGIDYHFDVLYKHPEWIEEAHSEKMKVNTWTVNKDKDMQRLIDMKVDYITTDNPLKVKELTNK